MIEPVKMYMINETLVDPDLAMEKREILHENVFTQNGMKLFTLTFKQVLQDFGVRNWNGRDYAKPIVMKGLDGNPMIQNDIKMGTWSGEYGHPIIEKGMNELARQMTIFPPNMCWTIDKYWDEGNILMGQCTTLAGGYGDLVRDRILTGYPAQASSRAIGGCDKMGHVLPGYMPITFDCVCRPSHKIAYMVKGSERMNEFPIPTDMKNTMTESATPFNYQSDSFKDFLLSESSTKQQISMLCDSMHLDYDTMTLTENCIVFQTLNSKGLSTVRIPLRQMVNAEYHNLF